MQLVIPERGLVEYHRKKNGMTHEFGAPMRTLTPAAIEVGIWPLSTTVRIDVPPHLVGGELKMTVDGVELTRRGAETSRPTEASSPAPEPWASECRAGKGASCRKLAIKFTEGDGMHAHPGRAAEFARAACDAGDAEGCGVLGDMLTQGLGLEANPALAAVAYTRSCDGGMARACFNLAMELRANETPGQRVKATELLRRSCDLGEDESCELVGMAYADGDGVPKNMTTAIELLQRTCEKAPRFGCHELSALYQGHAGGPQDPVLTLRYERKACDGGNPLGCHGLAILLIAQKATVAEALLLFERTCALEAENPGQLQAKANSCHNLGVFYAEGRIVSSNPARSRALFNKACDLGEGTSCHNLGLLFASGDGVPRDLARAAALFEKGCAIAPKACNNLGLMYMKGEGMPRDVVKARALFERACSGGSEAACKNLSHR
jgi:TPR repeat protein